MTTLVARCGSPKAKQQSDGDPAVGMDQDITDRVRPALLMVGHGQEHRLRAAMR
jgi:hypothetical protein